MPYSYVNDNYCDCPDGSDEPGTSACYYGRIFCKNTGSTPKIMSTAFVDDGVCDCCDGSDEPAGACVHTCMDHTAWEVQALQDKIAVVSAGLSSAAERVADARAARQLWPERRRLVEADVASKEAALLEAQVGKAAGEAAIKEATSEQSELMAARSATKKDKEEQKQLLAEGTGVDSGAEGQGPAAADEPGKEREETAEERARRVASRWTTDTGESEAEVADEGHAEAEVAAVDEGAAGEAPVLNAEEAEEARFLELLKGTTTRVTEASKTLGETTRVLQALESEMESLRREQAGLDKLLGEAAPTDFGPGDALLPLAGKCVGDGGSHFVYEVCLFDAAHQSLKYRPQQKTNLGHWAGFAEDHTVALFEGGEDCGLRGARRTRVRLECGAEEKLTSAGEPEVCAYEATLATPLLCTHAELIKAQDELASVLQRREELSAVVAEEVAESAARAAEDASRQAAEDSARRAAGIDGGEGAVKKEL
ncbi:hypothetical protein FOA52_013481 [Chlamydomonas sp. UWO 241]|nr:hypothetical protein FOA52_013481 [Chlamydomonas sp. UWO 241]